MLNMFIGSHPQLRSHPPLLCIFQQFCIKAAATHHLIVQKQGDELLAKGAIEPSSGGAGFYSNVFAVLKHTGGLWPMFNLKWFNCYMHIPTFTMPTIRHVRQLIKCGDLAFSIDLKDSY